MITLVAKVTNRCNARCTYCDATGGGRPAVDMSGAVVEAMYRRIDAFLRDRPDERAQVLWHGGEPLLLGPAFFERAADLFETLCTATRARIGHALQSNLTLFRPDFAPALRRLGIVGVGTSFDPATGARRLGGSQGAQSYRHRFLAGLAALRGEGFGSGVIFVVTRPALGRPVAVYEDLLGLHGNIAVQPVLAGPGCPPELAITATEYADFLGAILPVWWAHRERHPMVEPFRSLAGTLISGRPRLSCIDGGRCADSHFGIDPDGAITHCGRASDRRLPAYGSLFALSLAEVLDSPPRQRLRERVKALRAGECRACRFWGACHGGCPLEAPDLQGRSAWCYATRRFIETYWEPVAGEAAMSILIKHGDKFYEIPDEVLAKSGLSRAEFEARLKALDGAGTRKAAGQCNFIDLSDCDVDDLGLDGA